MLLKDFLKEKRVLVDDSLDKLLPPVQGRGALLFEAMRYSVFSGGKRLRPCLFLAAMEAIGRDSENFLPFACSLEMIHTYSLIHDDLPAMDNDDFRRGKPTCHKAFGEAEAILAGDALLTYAFNAMIKVRPFCKAERLLDAIDEVAWSAGVNGMAIGQLADILWEGKKLELAELEFTHKHKTGALFEASIISGAILADANDEELAALREFSAEIGLAFQIADDILDIIGDEKKLGKPIGSDEKNHKTTYASLFGLERARELAAEAAVKAKKTLIPLGSRGEILAQVPDYFIKRDC